MNFSFKTLAIINAAASALWILNVIIRAYEIHIGQKAASFEPIFAYTLLAIVFALLAVYNWVRHKG